VMCVWLWQRCQEQKGCMNVCALCMRD